MTAGARLADRQDADAAARDGDALVLAESEGGLAGLDLGALERLLPGYLAGQRWFFGKGAVLDRVRIEPLGSLPGAGTILTIVEVSIPGAEAQRYFLPLAATWPGGDSDARPGLASLRQGSRRGELVDASFDEAFARDLLAAMQGGGEVATSSGTLRFAATGQLSAIDAGGRIRPVGAEQSNVSLKVGESALLKVYRRVRPGDQPEIEVARHLTEAAGYRNTPAFLGSMEFVPRSGEPTALAAAFAFAPNQGDAWGVITDALARHLRAGADAEAGPAAPRALPAVLGRRTAELHAALAGPTADPAFAPEPVTAADLDRWAGEVASEASRTLDQVARLAPSLPGEAASMASELLSRRSTVLRRLGGVRDLGPSGLRTRIHGDYHLGQVLVTGEDVLIIDFEGEPQRSLEERRAKTSPLRDVAGLLRSFDYAAWAVLDRIGAEDGPVPAGLRDRALRWRAAAEQAFLEAYWPIAERAGFLPADRSARDGLLELFLLQKAFYEIGYEAASRPAWLPIPVRGVLGLLGENKDDS